MLLPDVTEWRVDCLQCPVMTMTAKTLKTKAGCEMDVSNIDLTSRSRDELIFAQSGWTYAWILLICQSTCSGHVTRPGQLPANQREVDTPFKASTVAAKPDREVKPNR